MRFQTHGNFRYLEKSGILKFFERVNCRPGNFSGLWDKQNTKYHRYFKYRNRREIKTIQIKSDETAQLLDKPYVNEVTLRGQNII